MTRAFEEFLIKEYHITPHSATRETPQARWEKGGFLPQMPVSLEQLDLLLLTVAKTRKVQQDGVQFMGMRYISPTLAAYVGEQVLVRYDPRDLAEIRLFYRDRFLCRAICHELAGETVTLREIVRARDTRRRQLRQALQERQLVVENLLDARRWQPTELTALDVVPKESSRNKPLKRYLNE